MAGAGADRPPPLRPGALPCRRRSAGRCRSSRRRHDAGLLRPRRAAPATASSAGGKLTVDVDQGHCRGRATREARRPESRSAPCAPRRAGPASPPPHSSSAGRRKCESPARSNVGSCMTGGSSVGRASGALPRFGAPKLLAGDFDRQRCALRSRPGLPWAADIPGPRRRRSHCGRCFSAAPSRMVPAGTTPSRRIRASTMRPPSTRAARVSPIPRSISHSGKRISRDLQQMPRLGQRQADDVGIAAGDVADIDFAIALQRIAAGLAAPFAVAGVIVDFLGLTAASSRSSFRPGGCVSAGQGWRARRRSARGAGGPTAASCRPRSVASSSTLGRIRRPTATTVSAASTSASGCRASTASAFSIASRSAWSRGSSPVGTLSSMCGGIDRVGDDADAGKQVEAARARRGEDQSHQAPGPGPPRPGMKR